MTIAAHNRHVISREDLSVAFLAVMLAGPVCHSVDLPAIRASHMPCSVQARASTNWMS
jgi:hypothetical protein